MLEHELAECHAQSVQWLRGPRLMAALEVCEIVATDPARERDRDRTAETLVMVIGIAAEMVLPVLAQLGWSPDQSVAACAECVRNTAIDLFDWQPIRRSIPPRTRTLVFRRDGYVCVECGQDDVYKLSLDHKIPVHLGGSNDPSNLITRCRSCNSAKGKELRP